MLTEGGIRINKRYLLLILIIGITMLIISIFFYQVCVIHGISMEPTLKNGNIALIKKYNLNLNYNDIVVVKKSNKTIIKRLVAFPGDTIIIDNYLYVNGKKNDDFYTENKGTITNEITLSPDEYFVIGDNRQNSIDSRFEEIGMISNKEIIGKIVLPKIKK